MSFWRQILLKTEQKQQFHGKNVNFVIFLFSVGESNNKNSSNQPMLILEYIDSSNTFLLSLFETWIFCSYFWRIKDTKKSFRNLLTTSFRRFKLLFSFFIFWFWIHNNSDFIQFYDWRNFPDKFFTIFFSKLFVYTLCGTSKR